MLTEVQYRSFDDLLDSIKIDLRQFDLEGMIDPQQLIKVAIKVNYELGLKINPSRSKAIEIHKGKGKLPLDFHVLNFALLCEGRSANAYNKYNTRTYTEGLLEGVLMAQQFAALNISNVRQYNVTMNIAPGENLVTHGLGNENVIVQAIAPDGTLQAFQIEIVNLNSVKIISEASVVVENVDLIFMAQSGGTSNNAEIVSTPQGSAVVTYNTNGRREEFTTLIPMRIEKSKSVSADCFNLNSHDFHAAVIKNGFLVTNFDEGTVYINYQSMMEDDQGNLLVMDHPLANEYYEYAIKQRIYENMYMSGENVLNYLQLVEQRLRVARNNALSFVNTPDFRELRKVWEMNRKAQYHNYYNMFKS